MDQTIESRARARAIAWTIVTKTPRNQPGGGWQVVVWWSTDRQTEKKEGSSLSGWRLDARPGVLDFWVYRVVTDCHRFDRLRFARSWTRLGIRFGAGCKWKWGI